MYYNNFNIIQHAFIELFICDFELRHKYLCVYCVICFNFDTFVIMKITQINVFQFAVITFFFLCRLFNH